MPKRYEEAFKREAVGYLRDINEVGMTEVNGDTISNVRDLCEVLDVSSYSLYKWDKEIPTYEPPEEADAEGFDIDRDIEFDSELPEWYPDLDLEAETEPKQVDWETVAERILDEMFGKRFYSWLARVFQIRNYSNKNLAQTQLEVGLKLIKKSGLVDIDKILKGLSL